tara:strand:+ start:167 stop:415 length:249 start_codon:yes stop_codon:yes gene_type:complete
MLAIQQTHNQRTKMSKKLPDVLEQIHALGEERNLKHKQIRELKAEITHLELEIKSIDFKEREILDKDHEHNNRGEHHVLHLS